MEPFIKNHHFEMTSGVLIYLHGNTEEGQIPPGCLCKFSFVFRVAQTHLYILLKVMKSFLNVLLLAV